MQYGQNSDAEELKSEMELVPASTPSKTVVAKDTPKSTPVDSAAGPAATQSIRVSVDLLENLMTTVSELVLTRNQLLQIARTDQETELSVPLQRLSQVTSELQEGVMKTRMQPIGNAWSKLPRLVRDLNNELGKRIELVMTGADTELDRQVLEMIRDPLTHMVRNSGDHGVETPEERCQSALNIDPLSACNVDPFGDARRRSYR